MEDFLFKSNVTALFLNSIQISPIITTYLESPVYTMTMKKK